MPAGKEHLRVHMVFLFLAAFVDRVTSLVQDASMVVVLTNFSECVLNLNRIGVIK